METKNSNEHFILTHNERELIITLRQMTPEKQSEFFKALQGLAAENTAGK